MRGRPEILMFWGSLCMSETHFPPQENQHFFCCSDEVYDVLRTELKSSKSSRDKHMTASECDFGFYPNILIS